MEKFIRDEFFILRIPMMNIGIVTFIVTNWRRNWKSISGEVVTTLMCVRSRWLISGCR